MNPIVSIITPCYNSSAYISQTIESVLNQTFMDWEMIIIDDFSTDNSTTIISNYIQKDSRIKLIKLNKNSGPAIARNKGIALAKGAFLTFIDADDLWFKTFLENSLKEEKKSEGFVFSSYERKDENLKPKYANFIVPQKVTYSNILKTNSISCLTAFINVKKLGKHYMPEVLYRQDMGLWLKYLKQINYAKGIKKPQAIYRIRKKSHSRKKINLLKHQWNFYRNVEKLSYSSSSYYMLMWIILGVKKYYL